MKNVLKPLLKKQVLQTASFFFTGNKDGKRRKPLFIFLLSLLIAYAVVAVVAMFWMLTETLCAPLVSSGLGWVYFAFMGTLATGLGCVGSVFAAKSQLFEAKDNDFLLSLPIPPWAILFVRMLSLYLLTFLFEALVFIPTVVRYFTVVGFQLLPALFSLAIVLILPLGTLALCALIGWLIAFITARIRAKNLLTVLFFAAFMIVYFLAVGKINEYLVYIVAHGEAVGQTMKTALFPFWQMGLAATGKPLGLLIFSAIFVALFALTYLLLQKTFLSVVTVKRGEKKKQYREKTRKNAGVRTALLKREFLRFFKNPMIFLNASLGSILFLVLCIFALFNLDFCRQIASSALGKGEIAVILAIILCFIASSNIISASSVSLEGNSLWILRSSPVSVGLIFFAKIVLHILVTAIPALIAAILLCALLGIPVWTSLTVIGLVVAITVLGAVSGLAINLKLPNLHWTNEVAAVKQGLSVLIAMFAGWGVSALLIGGYFLFGKYLPAEGYLGICIALFALASGAIAWWLKKRGGDIFESLQ